MTGKIFWCLLIRLLLVSSGIIAILVAEDIGLLYGYHVGSGLEAAIMVPSTAFVVFVSAFLTKTYREVIMISVVVAFFTSFIGLVGFGDIVSIILVAVASLAAAAAALHVRYGVTIRSAVYGRWERRFSRLRSQRL